MQTFSSENEFGFYERVEWFRATFVLVLRQKTIRKWSIVYIVRIETTQENLICSFNLPLYNNMNSTRNYYNLFIRLYSNSGAERQSTSCICNNKIIIKLI